MSNVVKLAPGFSSDSTAEVADGLQKIADEIRSGAVIPERVAIVIHHAAGECEPRYLGRTARRYEAAGLLMAGANALLNG